MFRNKLVIFEMIVFSPVHLPGKIGWGVLGFTVTTESRKKSQGFPQDLAVNTQCNGRAHAHTHTQLSVNPEQNVLWQQVGKRNWCICSREDEEMEGNKEKSVTAVQLGSVFISGGEGLGGNYRHSSESSTTPCFWLPRYPHTPTPHSLYVSQQLRRSAQPSVRLLYVCSRLILPYAA